jgi:hypothetical protein
MEFIFYESKILVMELEKYQVDDHFRMDNFSELFKKQQASKFLKIAVILPVRNEQDNLTRTLDALRNQVDCYGEKIPASAYEVLLLTNNCTDRSLEIALNYQQCYPRFVLHIEDIQLQKEVAHIGTVRRLLMDAAYDRFALMGKKNGLIASTDSDSEVDKTWIYYTLKEIARGNDVVGGRIFTKPERDISRLYYLRDITYKHLVAKLEDLIDPLENNPWPRHFQCFGASFAVTCQMYERCGRLPVVPFLEDMAFHRSLIRIDARIRLSPNVKVITSARMQGRVDFGLSIQLKQWGEMNVQNHPLMVESASSVVTKLTARKLLRNAWADTLSNAKMLITQASTILNLDEQWLGDQLQQTNYFGTIWESVDNKLQQQGWLDTWPLINITDAIPLLKSEIAQIKSGC